MSGSQICVKTLYLLLHGHASVKILDSFALQINSLPPATLGLFSEHSSLIALLL